MRKPFWDLCWWYCSQQSCAWVSAAGCLQVSPWFGHWEIKELGWGSPGVSQGPISALGQPRAVSQCPGPQLALGASALTDSIAGASSAEGALCHWNRRNQTSPGPWCEPLGSPCECSWRAKEVMENFSLQEKVGFIHPIYLFHIWYGDKFVIFSPYCYMKLFSKTVLCVAGLEGKTYTFFAHRLISFGWQFVFVVFFYLKSVFLSVSFGLIFKIMKNSVAPVMDLFV